MKIVISDRGEGKEDIIMENVEQFVVIIDIPGSFRSEMHTNPSFLAYAAMLLAKRCFTSIGGEGGTAHD